MDTPEMAKGLMNTRWPNFSLLLQKTPFSTAGGGPADHLSLDGGVRAVRSQRVYMPPPGK